ncbi:MAG: hypothetical protein JRJ31_21730, partial [Deltaproteobacteria bacterium]|nr:hypothetical protein [Deltaproteobacteria bacterium]
ANAYTTPVTSQPAGNPDGDGDGVGVYFAMSDDPDHTTYYTAIAAMAVAASGEPNEMVNVSGSPVNGWTYAQLIQDVVDYLAWGQTDSGPGRGGWSYGPTNNDNTRSDQSNTGYVTLALAYAETSPPDGMGVSIPGFVRSELEYWINYIQDPVDGDENDGGSWYSEPGSPDDASPNVLKTGNLLQQMAFVGDTRSSSRVQAAIDYMVRSWNSWDLEGSPLCYQSSYTTMKGLEAIGAEIIDSINWFQDLSDRIRTQQSQEGWWPVSCYDDGDGILSTEWAILTLQRAVAPTEENPDLEIIDLEVSEAAGNYTILFTLKNRGNVPAPLGHVVGLKVDGALVDQVSVNSELAPGETWSGSFAPRAVSGIRDAVQVCADETDVVAELNEDNNCSGLVWPPIGDISGDRFVTLADAILALQVSAGLSPAGVQVSGDVNGDWRIGLEEAVYVLQEVSGLR